MNSRQSTQPQPTGQPVANRRSHDIDELKRFVVVHARAQGFPPEHYEEVLRRIDSDDGDAAGSWVAEWSRAAQRCESGGDPLGACRNFTMARFPFVDGPAREQALHRCVDAFDRWRQDQGTGIEPVDVELPDGRVRCWTTGLSTRDPKPLLLVMGGIVTVKEQWAPVLLQARRLGMAGLVTELPGVGQNTLPYTADSWRMLPAVLDAVADRVAVDQTFGVTLSFSGHLALRAAMHDRRIRGIVTSGAPIDGFFTDAAWQRALPRVTLDTLAHLTGAAPDRVTERIRSWRLTGEQLRGLDIPVRYMASRRDEIIPAGDVRHLRDHVRDVTVVEYDDVHGAPSHVAQSRLWTTRAVLGMRGGHLPQRAVLAAVSGLLGLRARRNGVRS